MKKILSVFFLLLGTLNAQEVLDKVIAVIDNEIILKSELEYRVSLEAAQRNLDPSNKDFRKSVLDAMIDEKLLFAQAEIDSIEVQDSEIEQQMDYQINLFIQQFGSRERVEQVYGMSIDKIKRELKDDVRKNLMAQKVQQKNFAEIEVSDREVSEFFETYKDSLGLIPERFKVSHIFINPIASDRIKAESKQFAKSLLDSLNSGADFAELAKKYSADPGSAAEGGDLGYVKRGVFYPEFESVAFSLKPGETSGIVESPVGFHIIRLIDRRGESIRARHILIKPKNDDEADLKSIEFLTEIRDSIQRGFNTFEYYAKNYSDDKQTSSFGGELGTFEVSQLDKSLLDIIYKLEVGQISPPKRLTIDKDNYGFHIVKLLSRKKEHRPAFDEDYDEIKQLAQYSKRQKLYSKWMDKVRKNIYWEVRN
ncbi:peptidylprolyl isomerase [Patescibacteria group bacterium]|nr:peptidylprolyl isomerase [Patescibacteria group bacterium]MBU2491363.1 peptidylprolyl isomerase [Bacteroidota bacterium]